MAQESVDVVRRLIEKFGDLPASLPLVAPDGELIPLRAATEGRIVRGREYMTLEEALDAVGRRE